MNPVYRLGVNPELDASLGLLQPNELKKESYRYYWSKLYALATNLFKWEIEENPLYPTRFIEIILNTQGQIMFGTAYTGGRGIKKKSIGEIFAPYVSISGQLDFFGQETKVKMQPFNATGNLITTYTVMNQLETDFTSNKNEAFDKCVLGFNTQLRETIEWLPFICAKLALLDSAIITNVNLLKQPLSIVADEFTDFSANELVSDYAEGFNILKVFGGAGKELLDTLTVHQTGAQNYIETYQKVQADLLHEAYERMGISTNIVDKKERVLQLEQINQNAVSNLMYAEKYQLRQKMIEDIKRVFGVKVTCTPVLSLPDSQAPDSQTIENEDLTHE